MRANFKQTEGCRNAGVSLKALQTVFNEKGGA